MSTVPANITMPEFQSWIVESNRITNVDDHVVDAKGNPMLDANGNVLYTVNDKTDLENDFAPFLSGTNLDPSDGQILEGQAEIFIGKKTPFEKWNVQNADAAPKADLTILGEMLHTLKTNADQF